MITYQFTKAGAHSNKPWEYEQAFKKKARKEMVPKIHGQPKNQDLTILEKELIAILANIPTTLGEGNHGHAGIIVEQARYLLMMGVIFTNQPIQEPTQ